MTEFEKGFNEAIDKVLFYATQETENYVRISKELKNKKINSKASQYKALALIDFKIYIQRLFKSNLNAPYPENKQPELELQVVET